jgi:RimJ/RimL family protein N-acetyltransferase
MLDIMIDKIEGSRVNLRKIKRSDAAVLARNINDVTIARNTFIPHPYKLKDAHEFIRRSHREWLKGIGYHLGIEDRSTGEIVGAVGIESVTRKHRNGEMGYWLNKRYRGRGIMTEAVGLGLRFAFEELKLVRVHAHVMKGNVGSVRVLENNGFRQEGYLRKRIKHRGRWRDLHLFAILREEWKGR